MDETTKEIVALDLTTSGVHHSSHLPDVLGRVVGEVGQVSGDRGYDSVTCYEAILARGAVPTIPPSRNARLRRAKDPRPFRTERDAIVRRIKDEGRYSWRISSGATRQSLADDCMDAGAIAENALSRFKALVGIKLASCKLENQRIEALVKCSFLNRMAALGLPESERIPVA